MPHSAAGDSADKKERYTLKVLRNDGTGAPWHQRTGSREKEGRLRPRRPPLLPIWRPHRLDSLDVDRFFKSFIFIKT